jgi:hypothetical protein
MTIPEPDDAGAAGQTQQQHRSRLVPCAPGTRRLRARFTTGPTRRAARLDQAVPARVVRCDPATETVPWLLQEATTEHTAHALGLLLAPPLPWWIRRGEELYRRRTAKGRAS